MSRETIAGAKSETIGVLRPAQVMPRGESTNGFTGDGYSLTQFGQDWVQNAGGRTTADPSRLGQLLDQFSDVFGPGYAQRAQEAVRCYRTANYLACCAMAGAAAESILLALAIVKVGNEDRVLKEYRSAAGVKKVTSLVTAALPSGLIEKIANGTGLVTYWRNESAHGLASKISPLEAQTSLAQLPHFAQFVSDQRSAILGAARP